MNEKKYICAICGKSYDGIAERIACETKCLKEHKVAEAQKKANEIKAKRDASTKAIEAKLAEVDEMLRNHLQEHESFHLTGNYYYLRYIFSKTMWWF